MLNPTDHVRQGTRSALFEKSTKLLNAVRVVAGSLPSEGVSHREDFMSKGAWYVGNAVRDGERHRGWIVGHFMNADDDVRQSEGVGIKWGIHARGKERADWQGDESRTTVLLLVKGRFRLDLSVDTFVLEQEGDYAMGSGDRSFLASRGGLNSGHGEMAVRASTRSFERSLRNLR
jgi:hypothetical protein